MSKFIKDLGLVEDTKGKKYRRCIVECEQCGGRRELPTAKWSRYPDRLCKKCAQITRNIATQESKRMSFISEATAYHNGKFTYDDVLYTGNNKEIVVKCTKCLSVFSTIPLNHLKASGCPKCENVHKYSESEFLGKCKKAHPDLDYSITEFNGMVKDITVTCKIHGNFNVNAGNHLYKGTGCLSCSDWGDNDCLYVWRLGNTDIYKIGITSLRYGEARIVKVCGNLNSLLGTFYTPEVIYFEKVQNALAIEKHLHKIFNIIPLTHSDLNGKTEFRVLNEEDLLSIRTIIQNYQNKGLLS